jgi:hypothetical protein
MDKIAAMGLILTLTAGLCAWILLWSLGVKGFDAFLIPALMTLTAIAVRNLTAGLLGRRE